MIHCNFPIDTDEQALIIYNEIKVFIFAFDPRVLMSGQIVTMLEPCCGKNEEGDKTT